MSKRTYNYSDAILAKKALAFANKVRENAGLKPLAKIVSLSAALKNTSVSGTTIVTSDAKIAKGIATTMHYGKKDTAKIVAAVKSGSSATFTVGAYLSQFESTV